MIHAESYLVWNMAMCVCAMALGARLAGLPSPSRRALTLSALVNGTLALLPLLSHCAVAALLGLPGSVALCFRRHGFPACMRCTFTTLCASFLTGGTMTALLSIGLLPPLSGLITLLLGYAACLMIRLLPGTLCDVNQVEVRVNQHAILLPAMLDSGNLLRDPITGLQVLVVPRRAVHTLFPGVHDLTDLTALPLGFRLLNVRTAAGSALLPLFKPDLCRIYVNGRARDAELLVAVAGREYGGAQALVPMSAVPSHSS